MDFSSNGPHDAMRVGLQNNPVLATAKHYTPHKKEVNNSISPLCTTHNRDY